MAVCRVAEREGERRRTGRIERRPAGGHLDRLARRAPVGAARVFQQHEIERVRASRHRQSRGAERSSGSSPIFKCDRIDFARRTRSLPGRQPRQRAASGHRAHRRSRHEDALHAGPAGRSRAARASHRTSATPRPRSSSPARATTGTSRREPTFWICSLARSSAISSASPRCGTGRSSRLSTSTSGGSPSRRTAIASTPRCATDGTTLPGRGQRCRAQPARPAHKCRMPVALARRDPHRIQEPPAERHRVAAARARRRLDEGVADRRRGSQHRRSGGMARQRPRAVSLRRRAGTARGCGQRVGEPDGVRRHRAEARVDSRRAVARRRPSEGR